MKIALVLCIIAALGYGVGAVLQALGARRAAAAGQDSIGAMVKQPTFLIGVAADFVSWVISRFALHTLPLFAVQTILAGSLAVTVLLARVVLGAQLRRPDQWAIGATVVGLIVVGVSAGGQEVHRVSHLLRLGILLGIPGAAVAGFFAMKLNKSIVLAVLAGAAFTGSAIAARSIRIRHRPMEAILTSPLLWAVVLYAALALALHAAALTRGSVGPVTAAMWATEVLVAVVVGALALGDHMRRGWLAPAIFGIVMTLAATIVLARSPAQELEHHTVVA
ncbi:MAG: hypothetical protein JWM12_2784 [Ilumatobacteraceae bacterium]|nr:hypothetical protein [Ilumatobacteraceae bacterium]